MKFLENIFETFYFPKMQQKKNNFLKFLIDPSPLIKELAPLRILKLRKNVHL